MRFPKTLMLSAFVVLLGSSATIAQTAPTAKPVAGQSAPAAKPTDPAKQAISKACSDQAIRARHLLLAREDVVFL
jgi:hypothetical protein